MDVAILAVVSFNALMLVAIAMFIFRRSIKTTADNVQLLVDIEKYARRSRHAIEGLETALRIRDSISNDLDGE